MAGSPLAPFRPLPWLLRLLVCHLLPAWCCFAFCAGTASAMANAPGHAPGSQAPGSHAPGVNEPAPMCDPDGASVAAADVIPEVDRGRFEALPCEAQLLLAGWRPDAPEPGSKAVSVRDGEPSSPSQQAATPRPRFDGAREGVAAFPARSEPSLRPFAVGKGLAPSRGHARGLFRPPVARA